MTAKVLIVDPERSSAERLGVELGARGFEIAWRASVDQALEQLAAGPIDVVITAAGAADGDACARIASRWPGVPVLAVVPADGVAAAVAAVKAGAHDVLTTPVDHDRLARVVVEAARHAAAGRDARRGLGDDRLGEMIGASPSMNRVFDLLARVRDSDASVLIVGESGTGKELVARALHRRGRRAARPFVALNCAAVPETLLESELFGHTQGAFTDARAPREGLFVRASGGTLFLDEIGEMSPALQAKLLRALQERTVRPVGGDHETAADVRVIASMNSDPDAAVADGRMRRDLFFRLNVIMVRMPPLRARGDDALLLARHYVDRIAAAAGKRVDGLSPAVAARLRAYAWPGNVRELVNCVEHAVAMTRDPIIGLRDLPETLLHGGHGSTAAVADLESLETVEERHIQRVLEAVAGNKSLAAEILGIDRRTLYRKMRRDGDEA